MTSSPLIARVVLTSLVVVLGVSLGAGLYEHRIVLPRWLPTSCGAPHWDAAAAQADDVGRRFWAFVSTGPLTVLTVASLVIAWRVPGPARGWWLGAAVVVLADRALTFGYFIPTMIGLLRAPDGPESVAVAVRWATLNHVRHALTFTALLASLRALATLR